MFELTLICPCRNHVNANWPVSRDTPNSWDNCILFIVQACSKLGCPLDSGRHYTNKMEKDEVGFTFSTLHLFRLVFNQTTRQPDKTELDRGLLCPGEPLLHDTCIPFPFSNRTCKRGGVALFPNNDWKENSVASYPLIEAQAYLKKYSRNPNKISTQGKNKKNTVFLFLWVTTNITFHLNLRWI